MKKPGEKASRGTMTWGQIRDNEATPSRAGRGCETRNTQRPRKNSQRGGSCAVNGEVKVNSISVAQQWTFYFLRVPLDEEASRRKDGKRARAGLETRGARTTEKPAS